MAIYLSEKLKQFRKSRDLTQEQIADIFHVSPQAVSRWETGISFPDIEMLPSIAEFFKVTVDDLLGVDVIRNQERIDEILNLRHVVCHARDQRAAFKTIHIIDRKRLDFDIQN